MRRKYEYIIDEIYGILKLVDIIKIDNKKVAVVECIKCHNKK